MKQIKFGNPEIPGLAATQSRDFGIGKTPGIPGFGIGNPICLLICPRGQETCRFLPASMTVVFY